MQLMAMILSVLLVSGAETRSGEALQGLSERYDLQKRAARFDLPGRLREVSGLTSTPAGYLLAHGDERGRVYRIDPATEDVDRGFSLGAGNTRDDFEGVAWADGRLFLVSSKGLLYEFREAAEGSTTPVRVTDTGLGRTCEVEGLAFDKAAHHLLLACKTIAPPAPEARVHRIPLDPGSARVPPIRVALTELTRFGLAAVLHPSGIAVDPSTGTLVLVAAREEALVEIDRHGNVLSAVQLSKRRHPQPEGIAFGADGALYIADEANGRDARLTVYRRISEPGGTP